MDTVTVDVSSILTDLGASLDVERTWNLDDFQVGDERYVLRAPARVTVCLSNTGSGVVALGTVSADITAQCARCLCDFPLGLVGEVEAFFVPAEQIDSLPPDEEAAPIGPDGRVDLTDALLAALVVEAPFAPLHDAECAGICAECGADLNEAPCGCTHEEAEAEDHPFAQLRGLLPELPEGEENDSAEEDSATGSRD